MQEMYRDRMDSTRRVHVVSRAGSKVRCKVYFDDAGYAGVQTLPASLFEEPAASRYGFYVPAQAA